MARSVKRIVITGANGSGKTHFSRRVANRIPTAKLVSFDALKLTENWKQRPRGEIEHALATVIAEESWILEGGPSLLRQSLERANLVVWLDPPAWRRAARLLIRPWKHRGTTRPELPKGNVDQPLQQYRFAVRSLWRSSSFHQEISEALMSCPNNKIMVCRNARDLDSALKFITSHN